MKWKEELKYILKNNLNGVQSSDSKNANQLTINVLLDFTQHILQDISKDIYINAVNNTKPSNEQMNIVRAIRATALKWGIIIK